MLLKCTFDEMAVETCRKGIISLYSVGLNFQRIAQISNFAHTERGQIAEVNFFFIPLIAHCLL